MPSVPTQDGTEPALLVDYGLEPTGFGTAAISRWHPPATLTHLAGNNVPARHT
jgi:hypothetical protein